MPETHLNEVAGVWDSEAGAFISESHARLAAVLHDYNPYFSLVWVPPKDRNASDTKPFAILYSGPGKPPHIIRYLSEHEMADTTEILAWIFDGDLSKHRPADVFQKIENRERAQQLLQLKKKEAELADAQEFAEYVFSDKSPNTFKHNGQTYRK